MKNIPYTIVGLDKCAIIPHPEGFDMLVMMGGPMSVHEDDKYLFMKEEETLARRFISGDRKMLGRCLSVSY